MPEINQIYCADALVFLKKLSDKSVDLVLTDPPYGINIARTGKVGGAGKNFIGKMVNSRQYTPSDWDNKPTPKKVFDEIFRVSKNQIIFGGNHFNEWLKQGNKWIVWDKKATGNFSKCELIWTSFKGAIDKFDWEWNGFIQGNGRGGRQRVQREHPSQKPIELMAYLIKKFSSQDDLILDPFLGSGSSVVAAKFLKRNYLGVEISPEYIKIAEKRLAQEILI